MKSHRIWTLGALCWFFLLFNIERLVDAVNLASFVYVMAFLAGSTMLWSRKARELPFGVTSATFVLAMLVGKAWLGYSIHLETLPITILEVSSVVLSQILCLKVAQNTDEFAMTSRQLLDVLRAKSVIDIRDAEPLLQEEIRRARRHERPLAMVGLCPQEVTPHALRELVQMMEHSMGKEYVIGCISEILDRTTKSHDLAVRAGNHLLLLLPETNAEQAEVAVQRLKSAIQSKLGIDVATEVLEFGVDELTLTGILDRLQEDSLNGYLKQANDVFRLQKTRTIPVPSDAVGTGKIGTLG